MKQKKHKGMLDCDGSDVHSCRECSHFLGGRCVEMLRGEKKSTV
jgi:hypothetical protein